PSRRRALGSWPVCHRSLELLQVDGVSVGPKVLTHVPYPKSTKRLVAGSIHRWPETEGSCGSTSTTTRWDRLRSLGPETSPGHRSRLRRHGVAPVFGLRPFLGSREQFVARP